MRDARGPRHVGGVEPGPARLSLHLPTCTVPGGSPHRWAELHNWRWSCVWGCRGLPLTAPPLAGELLRVTHLARGADATGTLLLDSVISGSVPESIGEAAVLLQVLALPILPVGPCWKSEGVPGLIPLPASPQDFSERYVHTGAGRLSGGSVQSFLRDGRIIHAHCNHTIVYDPSTGLQPPRVQHVRASAVEASFNPALEELRFQLRASLDAGITRVFPGMGMETPGSWVAVRVQRPHPCSDMSLLSCLCLIPRGQQRPVPTGIHPGPSAAVLPWYGPFRGGHEEGEGHLLRGATSPSPVCSLDIDECTEGSHTCRYNQLCQNTAGTYRCACPPGYRSLSAGWPCLGTSWGLRRHYLGHSARGHSQSPALSSLSFPIQLRLPSSFLHQI